MTLETYKEENVKESMDAKEVLLKMFEDNEHFANSHQNAIEKVQYGQKPAATAVFCSDSRVNEHAFANEPFNYEFVIQNAGNLARINAGSIWYGFDHLKTPVLAIIGHTGCGAVYAAMEDPDHLPEDLKQVGEIVKKYRAEAPSDDKVKANAYFVEKNVDAEIDWLLQQEWVKKAQENGGVVVGLVYEINPLLVGKGKLRLINYNGQTDEATLKSLDVPYGRIAP